LFVKSSRDSLQDHPEPSSKEHVIFNNYSKKFEELLKDKCMVESKVNSLEMESEHLQNCLESATEELKNKDQHIDSLNQALQMLEDDLVCFNRWNITSKLNENNNSSICRIQRESTMKRKSVF